MSFDLLAPHYRWMEWLCAGEKLQRCRTALLEVIPAPANVLVYGEGNGRFLVELCCRFPQARVTVVEASTAMIELARARLRRERLEHARVAFIHTDALIWEPPASAFDLIVTCFFLDCFRMDQLQRLIPTIAAAGTAQAQWLVADFKLAESGLQRLRSRVVLALLYAFFRGVTRLSAGSLTAPEPLLRAAGFTLRQRQESDGGLLHSDWWSRGG